MSIRLIEVKTMQLKLFNSPKAPGYVILSHTWVEGEEVSFQEMSQIAEGISHIAKWKSGYRKIWETCRQTSSAEVTEAINSMFRWYRDAAVCIAYLSDYTCVDSSYMGDMKYCSWFTRGWCLQELIAPKYLVFYDKMWKEFGSKAGLAQLIASITRMDEPVLQDHTAMYSLPVAQRMSWASNRITTRVEDIAYCLLGIFDIHMPMLYGEGEKAFVRLQEEIIRRFNDTSIFLFSPNASELTQWEDIRTWGPTAMLEAISHHDDPELSTEGYIEESSI
ncbi:Vegetative incompatibility protein HET-E-1 [Colletotrichum fructicola]|nr:Vegetative incompatibility protein HET-E-1 [Colletotrichum fructicola]